MHDTLVVLGNCSSTYTCTSRVHDKTGEGEEHVTPIETRRRGRIFITYYKMFLVCMCSTDFCKRNGSSLWSCGHQWCMVSCTMLQNRALGSLATFPAHPNILSLVLTTYSAQPKLTEVTPSLLPCFIMHSWCMDTGTCVCIYIYLIQFMMYFIENKSLVIICSVILHYVMNYRKQLNAHEYTQCKHTLMYLRYTCSTIHVLATSTVWVVLKAIYTHTSTITYKYAVKFGACMFTERKWCK